MDLELTPEQQELQTLARSLLDERVPGEVPRAFLEGGGEVDALWSELTELGWYEVGLEPGDGFGVPGLCLLCEQAGRHLASTLLVDAAVAGRIVGEPVDRLALAAVDAADAETVAVRDGDGFRISGTKIGVPHARRVRSFGVFATLDDEPAFFLVDAAVVRVQNEEGLDPTSEPSRVVFDGAPAPRAFTELGRASRVGAVATAAEAVGAASAALELAVAYAVEREQFGRPIGSFQAVQHLLAEAYVGREVAWSTVLYAAGALDEDLQEAEEAATIAKAWVGRTAREVVELALQVLGGVGFTWEHDLHLYLRRVLACEQRFGDARHHETRLAAALAEREASRLATSERS